MSLNPIKIFFFLIFSIGFQSFAQNYLMYVGTFTTKISEGIYIYNFNADTGDLTLKHVVKHANSPGFLAISPNQENLYATSKIVGGAVHAYSIDQNSGNLTFLNVQPSGGENPCHVVVDQTGKWVIVGNYTAGTLSVLPIQTDGILGKPIQTIVHEGKSINPERQEKPHVHSINIAPNNKDVFVPDLGMDKIMTYQLDIATGFLTAAQVPFTTVKAGSGPRHFTFHPNRKFAYIVQEMGGLVTGFNYSSGKLIQFQEVSTLPVGYTGNNSSADIHISDDGKFLYASNRMHESIAVFEINRKNGMLKLIQNQDVKGKTPRNFSIDPTGKYLLVANQDSDNITIFNRNSKTGKLTFTGKEFNVSMPVCLKFLVKK